MNTQAPVQDLTGGWTFNGGYAVQPDNPPLLIAGDRLIGYYNNTIYAVNLYTGVELSDPPAGGESSYLAFPCQVQSADPDDTTSPPIVSIGGALFFPGVNGDGNNVLQGVRLVDGQPLSTGAWQQTPPPITSIQSMLAVRPRTGKFAGVDLIVIVQPDAVTGTTTTVSALRAADASSAWGPLVPSPPGTGASSTLSIGAIGYGDDAIFFVSGRKLFAVNTNSGDTRFPKPADGSTAQTYNITAQIAPLVAMAPPPPRAATVVPAAGAGIVICVGDQIWGFDVRTGALRWSYPTQPDPGVRFTANSSPISLSEDGTRIAVISDSNTLFVLDALTGEQIVVDALTGERWRQPVGYAGTPVIAGDTVFVCGSGQQVIASFDLATSCNSANYALSDQNADPPVLVSPVPPVIGNGHLFIQDSQGAIHAKPYASQSAAYFDGNSAHLEIPADPQFDFGSADFTIEAWVKSCEGGEILCGYPTDAGGAGFRLNLSEQGELRFAATHAGGNDQDLGKSGATTAADGFWHHVAVARRKGEVSFFVDGVASSPLSRLIRDQKAVHANGFPLDDSGQRVRDQLTPAPPPAPVAISGNNALFIGWDKYGVEAQTLTPYHFTGLMREVRLWNTALDAAAINSSKSKVLGPKGLREDTRKNANEPQLLGNWHLDDPYATDQQVTVENDVLGYEFDATFIGADSKVTDLTLDLSAFPYLLQPLALQWPYSGVWVTRGEHDITTPAVLSTNGIACFGTDNSLYGVRSLDGKRQWGLSTPEGHSFPIAAGKSFYVQDGEHGIIAIDPLSGAWTEVPAFQGLPMPKEKQKGVHRSAPAASGALLAAAGYDGTVWVADPTASDTSGRLALPPTAENPSDLQFVGNLVAFVAGADAALQLYVFDTTVQQIQQPQLQVPVDSCFFTLCGSRVFFTQGGQLTVIDTSKQPGDIGYSFTAGSLTTSQITGLAAASDGDILAVSTDTGQIYGLSMATLKQKWAPTAIPDGPAKGPRSAQGLLNAPTIVGRTVFCTSCSGAVAALDAGSGRLLGAFFEPTAVITPALVTAGTAFFGCAPADPHAPLDGALHSVVFGDTIALRVGVDASDKQAPGGYAVISSDGHLHVDGDDGECCVEAWINADTALDATGGEILSICPTAAGNLALRLFLDADGRVHFIGHHFESGAWQGVHAQTLNPAGALDGQWHHVAASRAGAKDVRIYVDGVQQSIAPVADDAPAAADIADKLEIRIGASAYQTASGTDTSFRGLIAGARLWDTYLAADQINDRMHTKLRGDEFSLVAAWDFSTLGVHDVARNGYDGALVRGDGTPATAADAGGVTFWLADLTFGHPDYPDVTTAATVQTVGDAGTDTTYQLTITCTKADRSPLEGALLRLWYVAHPGEQQPDTITLSTMVPADGDKLDPPVLPSQTVSPAPADQQGTKQQPGFAVYTNARGQAVVWVATSDPDHGPSLDLAADFMPANERLHVNVLIDAQALVQQSPPSLMVQTKLIQDYHYSPGDKIDDSRSRNTYRAVITALNGDHTPRPREWLEISALSDATIEVAGQSYQVNLHNAQPFQTDVSGQLVVVVAAQDQNNSDAAGLKTPDLAVWAGFMHQGERVTIALDQDAQQIMSQINAAPEKMTNTARLINWKRSDAGGSQCGALLRNGYEKHASEIANGIAHVASAVQPSPQARSAAPPSPPAGSGAKKKEARATAIARGSARRSAAARSAKSGSGGQGAAGSGGQGAAGSGGPAAAASGGPAAAASGAKKKKARPATPASGARAAAGDRFRAFRQPVRPTYGDRGQALRTQKHVLRRAPVTPESVLDSIQQASGNSKAVGFYLSFDKDPAKFAFAHFTADEADRHMRPSKAAQMASARVGAGMPLGWGFSDLWDDVESVADRALDAAKKIAIEITDKVTVAIHYVEDQVEQFATMVVCSIADAMDVIASFIEKIALLVWEFIEFLLFLFDWGAILATHDILKQTMFNAFDLLIDRDKKTGQSNLGQNMVNAALDILKYTPGLSHIPGLPDPASLFGSAAAQTDPQDRVSGAQDRISRSAQSRDYSGANGVSGTTIYSKMTQYSPALADARDPSQAEQAQDFEQIWHALSAIGQLLPNIVNSSPGDIGNELLDILKQALGGLDGVLKGDLAETIDDLIPQGLSDDDLSIPYHIPFISEIYKWITGNDLTLLDATCLMLALPVNIVYGVISGGAEFNKDAGDLAGSVEKLRLKPPSPAMLQGRPGRAMEARTDAAFAAFDPTEAIPWSEQIETAIIILRIFNGLLGALTDMMFADNPKKPDDWRSTLVVINGFVGAASAVLVARSMGAALVKWLEDEGYSVDKDLNLALGYAALATGAFPMVYAVLAKVLTKSGAVTPETADSVEYKSLAANGIAIYASIGATIYLAASLGTKSSEALPVYWVFQISQIWQSITQADACLYTQAGTQGREPDDYVQLAKIHAGLRAASFVAQSATAELLLNR